MRKTSQEFDFKQKRSNRVITAARSFFSRRRFLAAGAAGMGAGFTAQARAGLKQSPHGCKASQHATGTCNVRCFGAEGDGKTDDWYSIQLAINSVPSLVLPPEMDPQGALLPGTGEVCLPPGVYRVTKPLRLQYGMTFRGAGPESTILLNDSPQPCLILEGTRERIIRHVRVQGLTIAGVIDGPMKDKSGLGLKLTWAHDNHLSDLLISNVRGGVELDRSICNRLNNVKIRVRDLVNADCLRLQNDSNANSIVGCRFSAGLAEPHTGGQNRAIRIDARERPISGGAIVGCTFDKCDIGIEINGPQAQQPAYGIHIMGCHFESQNVELKVGTGSKVLGLAVTGNFFSGRSPSLPSIELNHCHGAFIAGNYFNISGPSESTAAAIRLTENASQTAFVGNAFTGQWKRGVEGPEGTHFNHYYGEFMNGGGTTQATIYPLRISGDQYGYFDLPVTERGRVASVEPEARRNYGRLFVTANGDRKELWVALGEKCVRLAEEREGIACPR